MTYNSYTNEEGLELKNSYHNIVYDTNTFRMNILNFNRCMKTSMFFLFLLTFCNITISTINLLYNQNINDHASQLDSLLNPLKNDSQVIHDIESLIYFACHYVNCTNINLVVT